MTYTVVIESLNMDGVFEVRAELLISFFDESKALEQAKERFSSRSTRIICMVKGDHRSSPVPPASSAA